MFYPKKLIVPVFVCAVLAGVAGSVIPEKEYTLSNLTVNALHAALLGLLVTIILPILLLAGGIVIFMVRRKK